MNWNASLESNRPPNENLLLPFSLGIGVRESASQAESWARCHRDLIFLELLCSLPLLHTGCGQSEGEKHNGHGKLLTKERADFICEKIAKGLKDNKIVGSANVIAYAMKESWFAGFEEGRKYPLKESK